MTVERAEQSLREYIAKLDESVREDALDDMETYLVGCDDPEDYFSKVEDDAELIGDFEDFMASGKQ